MIVTNNTTVLACERHTLYSKQNHPEDAGKMKGKKYKIPYKFQSPQRIHAPFMITEIHISVSNVYTQ